MIVGVVLVIFAILGLTSGENDDGSASQTEQADRRPERRQAERKEERPRVTAVRVRVSPSAETYLCVDRGRGTDVIYEDTTAEPVSFRGKHVRVNAGTSSVRISVNGKRVRIDPGPDPIGYDFRVRRRQGLDR